MDGGRDFRRRTFLTGAGALAAAGLGANAWRNRDERGLRAEVFVGRAASYDADLERLIADGLAALGLSPRWAAGKSVLLKPNLVEPSREAPHINTHPAVVRAAAEVFRRWGRARSSSARARATAATPSTSSNSRGSAGCSTRRGSTSST